MTIEHNEILITAEQKISDIFQCYHDQYTAPIPHTMRFLLPNSDIISNIPPSIGTEPQDVLTQIYYNFIELLHSSEEAKRAPSKEDLTNIVVQRDKLLTDIATLVTSDNKDSINYLLSHSVGRDMIIFLVLPQTANTTDMTSNVQIKHYIATHPTLLPLPYMQSLSLLFEEFETFGSDAFYTANDLKTSCKTPQDDLQTITSKLIDAKLSFLNALPLFLKVRVKIEINHKLLMYIKTIPAEGEDLHTALFALYASPLNINSDISFISRENSLIAELFSHSVVLKKALSYFKLPGTHGKHSALLIDESYNLLFAYLLKQPSLSLSFYELLLLINTLEDCISALQTPNQAYNDLNNEEICQILLTLLNGLYTHESQINTTTTKQRIKSLLKTNLPLLCLTFSNHSKLDDITQLVRFYYIKLFIPSEAVKHEKEEVQYLMYLCEVIGVISGNNESIESGLLSVDEGIRELTRFSGIVRIDKPTFNVLLSTALTQSLIDMSNLALLKLTQQGALIPENTPYSDILTEAYEYLNNIYQALSASKHQKQQLRSYLAIDKVIHFKDQALLGLFTPAKAPASSNKKQHKKEKRLSLKPSKNTRSITIKQEEASEPSELAASSHINETTSSQLLPTNSSTFFHQKKISPIGNDVSIQTEVFPAELLILIHALNRLTPCDNLILIGGAITDLLLKGSVEETHDFDFVFFNVDLSFLETMLKNRPRPILRP